MRYLLSLSMAVIFSLLILSSCKSNGTGPSEDYKDPREMTWTVDTVFYPYYESFQTIMNSIYIVDSNNIWLCGHCDDIRGILWHYNNSKWSIYDLFGDIPFANTDLFKFAGFYNGNLWIVGARGVKSLLLKFNFNKWSDISFNVDSRLLDGYITTEGILNACGDNGIVFSYDFLSAGYYSIPPKKEYKGYYYALTSIVEQNNKKYLLARYEPTSSSQTENAFYFLEGDYKQWKYIDSFKLRSNGESDAYTFGNYRLYSSPWGKLYSVGGMGLWLWKNNRWEQEISTYNTMNKIFGVREDYIYAIGHYGAFYFYNGVSWRELKNIIPRQEDMYFMDVWTNGKMVYVVASINGSKTLIIKGK